MTRGKLGIYIVLVVQLMLLLFTFKHFFLHPNQFVFQDRYDGLKNYFTYQSYLEQDNLSDGALLYKMMNYPYGDLIYYTDNSPPLALFIKGLDRIGLPVKENGIGIYNLLLIFQILALSLLLYYTLKRLLKSEWLIILLSISLPWINPQFQRLGNGHFSLSLAILTVGVIYLCICLWQSKARRQMILNGAKLTGLMLLAALFHFYYLPIYLFFTGFFLLFWIYRNRNELKTALPISGGIVLLTSLIFFSFVRLTDIYYEEREAAPTGYDWDAWNMRIEALVQSYDYMIVPFPAATGIEIHYESKAFLGSFSLWTFVLIILSFPFWKGKVDVKDRHLLLALFICGLICMFTAMGHHAQLFGKSRTNYFSAFLYLSKISESFKQFRCMSRFNWPFFWCFNFSVAIILDSLLNASTLQMKSVVRYAVICFCSVFLFIDAYSIINYTSKLELNNPLYFQDTGHELYLASQSIQTEDYQAILPIPYYHEGSESDYSIGLEDSYTMSTFQFSTLTSLPLMSCKMSRTSKVQAESFFDLLAGELDPNLKNSLDDKPILVFVSKNYMDMYSNFEFRNEQLAVIKDGISNLDKVSSLEHLGTYGSIELYKLELY